MKKGNKTVALISSLAIAGTMFLIGKGNLALCKAPIKGVANFSSYTRSYENDIGSYTILVNRDVKPTVRYLYRVLYKDSITGFTMWSDYRDSKDSLINQYHRENIIDMEFMGYYMYFPFRTKIIQKTLK